MAAWLGGGFGFGFGFGIVNFGSLMIVSIIGLPMQSCKYPLYAWCGKKSWAGRPYLLMGEELSLVEYLLDLWRIREYSCAQHRLI